MKHNVEVIIYDSLVKADALKDYIRNGVTIVHNLESVLKRAAAYIVASNASEFKVLEKPKRVSEDHPIIIDGRCALNVPAGQRGYFAIGRAIKVLKNQV